MARLSTDGLAELSLSFEEIAATPDEVLFDMLSAEGEIVKKAQSDTARSMLQGPYYQGAVAQAVTAKKPRRSRDGASLSITFQGTQHGNRIAEIAFVNEFGKKNQPARPFIQTANERSAEEAVEAAAKVYDGYLSAKGL